MEISVYLLVLVAVAILGIAYISRDKLKRSVVEWLNVDPIRGDISYTLSESTTAAFEEIRGKLHRKYPKFELVKIRVDAGKEKTLLEYSDMSKEELRRSGEEGYGVYGRLFVFRISLKVNNDVSEVVARCRVESSKPGIWKADFVEFDGAEGQTGHPHKLEISATPASPAEALKKIEIDDVPSLEDAKVELGRDAQLSILPVEDKVTTEKPLQAELPVTPADKPRPRRRRSANTLAAISDLSHT